MSQNQTEDTSQEQKPAKVGLIAVVQNYAGPGEARPIAFVHARTKREMAQKLKDPQIATVISLLRGRVLGFKENRQVTF